MLEECAKKLEQTIKNVPLNELQTHRNNSQLFYSTRKTIRQRSFLEKLVCRSEKKSMRKSSASKLWSNSSVDKENKPINCIIKLFNEENSINEIQPVKRESLGLLPESCLEDDFLSTNINILQEMDENMIPQVKNSINYEDVFREPSKFSLGNLSKEKFVRQNLSELLHQYNRQIIWSLFENLDDNLQVAIVKNIIFDEKKTNMYVLKILFLKGDLLFHFFG